MKIMPKLYPVVLVIILCLIMCGCNASGTSTSISPDTPLSTNPILATQIPFIEATTTSTSTSLITPSLLPPVTSPPLPSSEEFHLEADGSGDFPTLAEAVMNVPQGATLLLGAGVFQLDEALEIDKPLSLVGQGMDQTEIVSDVAAYTIHVKVNGAFSAEGITFRHEGSAFADAVDIEEAQVTIQRCRFSGGKMNPDNQAADTDQPCPERCIHERRGSGLRLRERTSGDVKGNYAEENFTGIWVFGQNITLERNFISRNKAGMAFGASSDALAIQNYAEANEYNGFVIAMTAKPVIEDNTSIKNGGNGFWFQEEATGSAARNNCSQNQQNGILVDGKTSPTLEKNTCNENGRFGILFMGNAAGSARSNIVMENQMSGILLSDYSQVTLEENTCSKNNRFGIAIGLQAKGIVRKNTCSENLWTGIMVAENAAAMLEKNLCSGNIEVGIAFQDQASGLASMNQCIANGVGIFVQASANPDLVDNDAHDNKKADILDERPSATPNP